MVGLYATGPERFDRDDVAVLALARTSPKWKLAIW
jgi:hypothetical protein